MRRTASGWEGERTRTAERPDWRCEAPNWRLSSLAREITTPMKEHPSLSDADRIERLEAKVAELEALLREHLIKCPGTRDQETRAEAEAI